MLFRFARQQSAHHAAKRSNYTERSTSGEGQAAVTSHASPRQRNKQPRHCETSATVGEMSIVRRPATGRNTALTAGPIGDL
jgi:hypothetical protein